jgi:hypothetical protein
LPLLPTPAGKKLEKYVRNDEMMMEREREREQKKAGKSFQSTSNRLTIFIEGAKATRNSKS